MTQDKISADVRLQKIFDFMKLRLINFITIIATLLFVGNGNAQVYVNGHRVAADKMRSLWLCTLPEADFGSDVQVQVTYGDTITALTIDGQDIISGDSILIDSLNGAKALSVEALTTDGTTLNAELQFTFLPIVEFAGKFSRIDFVTVPFSIMRPDDVDISALAKIRYRGSLTNQNYIV